MTGTRSFRTGVLALAALLGLLPAAPVAVGGDAPRAPAAPAASGIDATDVTADTTWTGTVRLASRVKVAAGATLRVERGARVVIPFEAAGRTGDARPGLEVYGGLEVLGEADAPVRFEPEAPPPGTKPPHGTRWLGIVVFPGGTRPARLSGALVIDADAGWQPGRSDALAADCGFWRCGSGVGVGAIWEGKSRLLKFPGDVTPRLERCRFAECEVGVTVERGARPEVVRCVFLRCRVGVGNERPGILYPPEGLGPHVERCEFLACRAAVVGPSRVADSIFEGNELVYAGSPFGEQHVTVIDRFVRGRNLYAPHATFVRSDVPLGDDAIVAPVGRRGDLPAVLDAADLLGPLEHALGLAAASPGVGRASDGGDLGAFGAVGAPRAGADDPRGRRGLAPSRYLVLGPELPGLLDTLPVLAADAVRRPRAAGDPEGDAVWAVLDAADLEDDEASRRAAATFPGVRVLLATFSAEAEGRAALRLGFDGTLEAWWNGAPLAVPPRARRYRPDDVAVRVSVRKGANALLLRHTPRATTARCVARLLAVVGGDVHEEAPPGVAAYPVEATAVAPKAATSASFALERGRDGKPTGKALLKVTLTGPVHWRGLFDRRRYALRDAKGVEVPLDDAPLHYRPAERTLLFTLPVAPRSGAYSLTLEGLRTVSGSRFAEDPLRLPLRLP